MGFLKLAPLIRERLQALDLAVVFRHSSPGTVPGTRPRVSPHQDQHKNTFQHTRAYTSTNLHVYSAHTQKYMYMHRPWTDNNSDNNSIITTAAPC